MPSRPLRALASVSSTFALVAAGIAVTTSTAHAAVGDDPCPAAFDTADLVTNQPVTGLTTTEGTDPDEFHGTYKRTIKDGIAPGMDLLVFKMEGSRITKPTGEIDAGIWAGMSGSPVYDDATGELIGAVSYGFSNSPSDIAGVTPAAYMYDLQNPKYNPTTLAAHATVSKSTLSSLQSASEGDATLGQPRMLRPKKQVSGASAATANAQAARSPMLQRKSTFKKSGFVDVVGQSSEAEDYPIVVGGNLATTFSYGEVTTAAVGTVTAICDGKVIGFGHPDEFSGKSAETFHGASTVEIQPDVLGSYKLANVGQVKGVINQDRLQGILGTIDQVPNTIKVNSTTTGLGDTKESTTDVSVPFALSYVVATQVASDAITVLNQYSSGDALMTWKIDYIRKIDGVDTPGTFQRTQRFSTDQDFPDEISYDAASDVETLMGNSFEKVKITNVDITSSLQPDYRAFKPVGAQYYTGGVWKNVYSTSTIKAKPGATLKLRVKLAAADFVTEVAPTTVDYTIKTNAKAKGTGTIRITGEAFSWEDEEEEFFGFDDEEEGIEPESLDELLALIKAQPRSDDMLRRITYRTSTSTFNSYSKVRAPGIVKGTFAFKVSFAS